jgi:NADPH-dependent curcumin reductase CurA
VDPKEFNSTIKTIHVKGWDIWDFTSSGHKVIREFYDRIPKLIEQGVLRGGTVPLHVWPQGLEGIPDAIDYVRQGKTSGQKVVVNIV